MKINICPLCDHEMKKAHYCDTCHSFIWKPESMDVHYNAESRHMNETDCAYSDHSKQKTTSKARTQKQSGRMSYEDMYKEANKRISSSVSKNSSRSTGKKNKNPITKIIFIIILLNIIIPIISFISESGGLKQLIWYIEYNLHLLYP